VLAQDALERFALDEVLFVPCSVPPHKAGDTLAPARDRLAMLRAAVRGNPRFRVLAAEIERGGVSYSVETLRALRRARPGSRFHFIIGLDTLYELHTWREIYELLRLCTFVTMFRPGRRAGRRIRLRPPWPARLRRNLFAGHAIGVSASEIRARRARGEGIRYLVPAAVERYILARRLYGGKESRRSKRWK
jgi:nicotinate-nucleotide adenylyltransferase